MRNTNKKGFTIVELVVVVAVIAILAAVLIPTFSGIIRKANISADTAIAQNLNKALEAENVATGIEDFGDVRAALRKNGFLLADLNAKTEGCYFVWDKSINRIILVDANDTYKVIYCPTETYSANKDDWFFAISDPAQVEAVKDDGYDNVQTTIVNSEDLLAAFDKGGETVIQVDESLVINKETVFVLDKADAKITIDLGETTVTGNNSGSYAIENVPFVVKQGELNIVGGNIQSTGAVLDADKKPMNNVINSDGGVVNVEGATIETVDAVLPIALSATTSTIKDTTIITGNNAIGTYEGTKLLVENCKVEADYLAVFASYSGGTASEVTINGGVYHTTEGNLLGVYGGKITIEDGVFNCDKVGRTFKIYKPEGGSFTIKGGTFNGVAFENLTEDIIRGMCNFSAWGDAYNDELATRESINEASKAVVDIVKGADGAWTITIK